ncbi:MAG: hypothetical protein ACAI38_24955 [Myxococcota bacterium]|nr:hypothetical protein [Myxococcota bacterium]
MTAPAAVSDAVVAHVRAMRGWLRFFAVTAVVVTLWLLQLEGASLLDLLVGAARPRLEHLLTLVTVITLSVCAHLIWRQANAATRFVAAPSEELFVTVTSEMRRFWRICGPLGVCLGGLLLVGFFAAAS